MLKLQHFIQDYGIYILILTNSLLKKVDTATSSLLHSRILILYKEEAFIKANMQYGEPTGQHLIWTSQIHFLQYGI